MKIDRLIGILSVLLQSKQTTAPELAELFEVSRRTINRDIETLSKAGVPIMTLQGSGGGISIMDGYRVDRTILTSKDMRTILAGLRSLDSVSGSSYYSQLMEKLELGSSQFVAGKDSVLIDLSSWYRSALAPKIEVIQQAIEDRHLLSFRYFAPGGESKRLIEPYYLVFRWSNWYLWGWCTERNDFRLFKLNRMTELAKTGDVFICREVTPPDLADEKIFPGEVKVKALFDPEVKWRLVDEFGLDSFTETEDGKILFTSDFSDEDSILTWFMTFGEKAEVIEPEDLRKKLIDRIGRMMKTYQRSEEDGI